jgi:hypothetical protein
MGCGGRYSSIDSTIIAVGPADYSKFPCGTRLTVTGPEGTITVTRQDSCPGCYNMVDLSERGHELVCGVGTCTVTLTKDE